MHAVINAKKKFKNIDGLELYVMRFGKKGNATMAKPCKYCQEFLKKHEVNIVHYTDQNGIWNKLTLKD